ncbi:hypothetical protein F5Y05DRAFT_392399 [Hypoxylon sp. FL0543]|nr:hypothetical protein F5Y05DRAFT_392399 [Hypoxylon sp. FL0543]
MKMPQTMAAVNSSWSPAVFLAPLHILSYSTLLGIELYQSFVLTKLCYRALPKSAFTTLQKHVFPVYFRSQALLLLLTAVTIPPYGPFTLQASKAYWVPFAIAGATGLLNLTVYGPRTRRIMIERIYQGTQDEEKPNAATEMSDDTKALNKSFSRNHAMSIHLNLVSIGAMIWWSLKLASRLDFQT